MKTHKSKYVFFIARNLLFVRIVILRLNYLFRKKTLLLKYYDSSQKAAKTPLEAILPFAIIWQT